jgi:hypothetical protein
MFFARLGFGFSVHKTQPGDCCGICRMTIELRRLTPSDLEQVIALEYKLFPREFCYNVAKTQEILTIPHIKGKNHSVGAFDREQLVGYILMFEARSEIYSDRAVTLVWELATAMHYRPVLSRPFMEWIIREAHRCGLIVETRLRERTALRMVRREYAMIQASRYRITHMMYAEPIGGERMIVLRFEPVIPPSSRRLVCIDALGICAERLLRTLEVLPLRFARHVCYSLPARYVPLPLLQMTYLAPSGAEPAEVRTDVG